MASTSMKQSIATGLMGYALLAHGRETLVSISDLQPTPSGQAIVRREFSLNDYAETARLAEQLVPNENTRITYIQTQNCFKIVS